MWRYFLDQIVFRLFKYGVKTTKRKKAMMIHPTERESIRKCSLVWHCHEIVIEQTQTKNGFSCKGHGSINVNKNGRVFLDFICMESNLDRFLTNIPEDRLDKRQTLSMRAITLDGIHVEAQDFQIKMDFLESLNNGPIRKLISLKEITLTEIDQIEHTTKNYMYMEFNEEAKIPKNKSTITTSTSGASSASWNQSEIVFEGITINVTKHKNYTAFYASGDHIQIQNMENSILLYIGFTSGKYIQPYFKYIRENSKIESKIVSIDREILKKDIPAPIPHMLAGEQGKLITEFHFELLKKIYNFSQINKSLYSSIYSQWKRVWFSFLSPDWSVAMLSLSVSIEGILNDIFIPPISKKTRDAEFNKEKEKIISKIEELKEISPHHIKNISSYVRKWGNTTPKKSLTYLKDKEIISDFHVTTWERLRNSSAHPKLDNENEDRREKDINRITICLGLFYRLILNSLEYQGLVYTYKSRHDNESLHITHIDILNNNTN